MTAFDVLVQLSHRDGGLTPPPPNSIATGDEEHVYLWLTHVQDAGATSPILEDWIAVGEATRVAEALAATRGLLAKRATIDNALDLRSRLLNVGTTVELVTCSEAEALLDRIARD